MIRHSPAADCPPGLSCRTCDSTRPHAAPRCARVCGARAARLLVLLALCGGAGLLAGCHHDMRDQPRYEPDEPSRFFSDGRASRPLVAGTVARGQLAPDDAVATGKQNGELVRSVPIPVNRALLERGESRFNIFCTPCHAPTGTGRGMVVQRGFRQPPSYAIQRLIDSPDGHVFDVITRGFGAMPPYGPQIPPRDRWAIVAYVRALQLAQNGRVDDVPAAVLEQLRQNPQQSVPAPAAEPRASNDHMRSFRRSAINESTHPGQVRMREYPGLHEPELPGDSGDDALRGPRGDRDKAEGERPQTTPKPELPSQFEGTTRSAPGDRS